MNNEGFDSKGGLPFFADEPDNNGDAYIKLLVDNGPPAAPPSPPEPAATTLLTVESVMRLNVAQLKDELKKRGQLCVGKKSDLQDWLKEAILNNVPVSSGNEPPCQECMARLDIKARWELLTYEDKPIPLPENRDPGHHPPTKMDGSLNLKYGIKETFDCRPFTGTTEKMRYYLQSLRQLPTMGNHRKERKRKCLLTRQLRAPLPIKPRVLSGPNGPFMEPYGLDETSHPMDWFMAFMPLTPTMNREDPGVANVKGDKTTKFAISNWTAYSNMKVMICNTGEPGHIFAGKFKPFKNDDILQMIGVYIIDNLALSPQLVQKMQPQEKQPTHGNNRIASVIRHGWQQKHQLFRHFFACQDPLMTPPPKNPMSKLQD